METIEEICDKYELTVRNLLWYKDAAWVETEIRKSFKGLKKALSEHRKNELDTITAEMAEMAERE